MAPYLGPKVGGPGGGGASGAGSEAGAGKTRATSRRLHPHRYHGGTRVFTVLPRGRPATPSAWAVGGVVATVTERRGRPPDTPSRRQRDVKVPGGRPRAKGSHDSAWSPEPSGRATLPSP